MLFKQDTRSGAAPHNDKGHLKMEAVAVMREAATAVMEKGGLYFYAVMTLRLQLVDWWHR